ncbi:molybdopterin molybdotransferase [Nocardioides terrae]|uniref:Molybdopterin molybdenumtransferase n=1 Tax=Nocardioides terrae TaxID=574651 RepID=A0A1I1DLN1_9ACTN|nr:molybdopterin-binding protein [Nocardioides terrae]SFB73630.1 molybdopterin molybdotransferase [Nocardioides terrae]
MVLGWAQARRAAYDSVVPLTAVTEPLAAALGLRLAAPLVAAEDLPGFDNAAMDGYAVAGAPPWRVVGRSLAGDPPPPAAVGGADRADRADGAGEAWEVATGAHLPPGTRSVLPVEDADVDGALVSGCVEPGRHVRHRGEEALAGEVLLAAGTRVTPQVVALAAAVGVSALSVVPAPRVAALVTGSELGDGPGRVRDALGPALPGWVAWAGGTSTGVTRLIDDAEMLRGALGGADAEVVVVTGSSSVGREDHVRPLLAELGATPVADGVDCRPGSLAGLWRLADGRLVAALPGNPFAALVAFVTVVAPALGGLRGDPLSPLGPVTGDLSPHRSATRLVPVRLTADGVVALGHDHSAMLRGVAAADALAVVPPEGGTALLQPLPV